MKLPAIAAALLASASPLHAEHFAALLIGNSAYPDAELAAPGGDLAALGKSLRDAGVAVTAVENLRAADAPAVVKEFARGVPTRGTAIVYFSGYALRGSRGDVALLPIDGKANDANAVAGSRFGVGTILRELAESSGSGGNLVLVDGSYRHPGQKEDYDGAPAELETFPEESVVIFSAPFGETVEPPAAGERSLIAEQIVTGLKAGKPLGEILHQLGGGRQSSLGDGEKLFAGGVTRAASPPDRLGDGKRPGDEWVSATGGVYCWCPPGQFRMGSGEGEAARQEDEIPADVRIARGFWISKYEFTRCEAKTLTGRHTYLSTGDHKLQPLNKFRKDDPARFLAALNETAPPGWEFALPTEAEWEYAARAGTRTAYWFGDDPSALVKHGNFADRSLRESDFVGEFPGNWQDEVGEPGFFTYAHKTWSDGHARFTLAGAFPANAWGLHDVCGNLAELTSTPYHPERTPREDFDELAGWVCKGGSWLSTPDYCRSAFRGRFSFRSRENGTPNYLGLRPVLRRKGQ